jgi:hypothetical protein
VTRRYDPNVPPYGKVSIKPIGKYIHFAGIEDGMIVLDYAGNILTKFRDEVGFFRVLWNLNLLRLGQEQGEHFFGHRTSLGTVCGSDIELIKCLDDGTCESMCPPPQYASNDSGIGAPFYDAKTKLLFIDGIKAGERIYKFDPVTGYIDDWRVGVTQVYYGGSAILPYDDTYFYLLWQYQPSRPSLSDLYKCKWDTLRYEWKSTVYLKDTCELVEAHIEVRYDEEAQTIPEQGGWMVSYYAPEDMRILKPDGTYISLGTGDFDHLSRIYATKYMTWRRSWGSEIKIYDLTKLEEVQTISLPYADGNEMYPAIQRLPFIVLHKEDKYYIYLLKYGNYAPIIQYNPSTRKFRVIDLITGNPITAKVKIWCSSIGYPSSRFPLAITPSEITVSDWTSPPPCGKGAVTIEISDVV